MKKYFELEESVSYPHKFLIKPIHKEFEKFFSGKITGAYCVLPSRLMDLSYPDYLRFCRDILKAEIIGKGSMYPLCCFTKTEEVQMFLRLLNKRMEYLESEFDNRYEYIKNGNKIERIPFEEL